MEPPRAGPARRLLLSPEPGPPEAAERRGRYDPMMLATRDAGCRHLMFRFVGGDRLAQVDEAASKLLPQLKGR